MKPLITTCLALCAVACGSGGQGPEDYPLRPQTTPANRSQAPERPSDTVPPLSSQQPPMSSQTPPSGSQSAGPASVAALTCPQVTAAVNRAGCTVSDSDIGYCEKWSALGSPCATLLQNLLECLMQHAVCDDDGRLDRDESCPGPSSAVEACVETYDRQVTSVCSPESQCTNCPDACTHCICEASNASDLEDCADQCAVVTD